MTFNGNETMLIVQIWIMLQGLKYMSMLYFFSRADININADINNNEFKNEFMISNVYYNVDGFCS